jgi:hypothetical protein
VSENLPVFLNFETGSEIIFARQFKKKFDAAKALPYTPFKMPLTAEKALKLNVGDFVSMPVRLHAVTGFNVPMPTDMIFAGGASTLKLSAGIN